jgi:2-oxoisovalerate dehydrogenase E2 component (dihydrolipoyl transacylase)
MNQQFLLPDVGEGLTEGEVLRWLVDVGDSVIVNQPLVEVETAKAAVELPSPYAGVVAELHAAPGDVVLVGAPLISIASDAAAPTAAEPVVQTAPAAPAPTNPAPTPDLPADAEASGPLLVGYGVLPASTRRRARLAPVSPHGTERPEAGPPGEAVKPVRHGGLEIGRAAEARFGQPSTGNGHVRTKPPVRKLARDLGVDLGAVRPTGPDATVTRSDVEAAAALVSPPSVAPALSGATAGYAQGGDRGERREPVRSITRRMAQAMTRSASEIPHVTVWLDVDVTRSVELLDRLRVAPAYAHTRVTPMLLVARACLFALKRTPQCNAVYDTATDEIVHRGAVNLGFAAATERGLVVPNVKSADLLPLPDLAVALAQLTASSKSGQIAPADLTGGTFTITNVGVFGVDGGTPIINPGESAILAVGAWRQRPWVHRGELAIRTVATVSMSFDHRFIDGATGSRFVADVAAMLEEPAADLSW